MLEVTNSELTNVYEKLKKLITDSSSELGNKIDLLTNKLEETEIKLKILEKENKILNKQIQDNLREKKKNNIVIFGLEEEEQEDLYDIVLDLFKNQLQTTVSKTEINHMYRIGRQDENKRAIIVKFVSFHTKLDILKKGYLLKETSISLTNDLIKEDRDKQKVLRRHLKYAKEQKLEVKISKNKLIVENSIYSVDDLLKLEKEHLEQEEKKQTEKPQVKSQKTKTVNTKETADQDKKIKTPIKGKQGEIKTRIIYGLRSGTQTGTAGTSAGTAAGTMTSTRKTNK